MGMFGIYIHQLKHPSTKLPDVKGRNPFENVHVTNSSPTRYFSDIYPTYDWVANDGYTNFGAWVEAAARAAGR